MLIDSPILSSSEICLLLFACPPLGIPAMSDCPGAGPPRAALSELDADAVGGAVKVIVRDSRGLALCPE
eukprot:6415024-Pyramimonas_sp.AAC.1